jgi:DNA-binding MarR family transcriptional regulator
MREPGRETRRAPGRRGRSGRSLTVGGRRLPALLRRAWYGLNQAFRHQAAPVGITPDQYTVLRLISEQGRRRFTQGELTRWMSSDPNTVASLLRRMERQGLVERRPHPTDRRARCLTLRGPGRRRFKELLRVALALQERVLAALPDRERTRFLRQLERVADACWEAAATTRPGLAEEIEKR